MFKRLFILILALCCAFSFVAQPAAATGAELVFSVLEIGMAIAGAFGLTFASNSSYEAFGNNIHNAVISTPGPAGSEWWNRSLAGNIILTGMDEAVKTAVWSVAKLAADATVESESVPSDVVFTLSSYNLDTPEGGNYSSDYRGLSFTCSRTYDVPIYCVEFCYTYGTNSTYPYRGIYGAAFVSSERFTCKNANSSEIRSGIYFCYPVQGYWIDDTRIRTNCLRFDSPEEFYSYCLSLTALSSGVSSAGGATAAYPAYGYDGVNLPNIDLTQAGLIGEDGTSTVSDLIAQLQSGAITWEDYIGTVAPGQTATITLTDAAGATITYKLTNTGVGEKVDTGGDPQEETKPIPVVPPGEGSISDAVSLLQTISDTVTAFMEQVGTLLTSIYDWAVELGASIRTFFETVIAKIQAFWDSMVEWLTAVKDAIVQLGIQVGEFIATAVETLVTTIKTWLQWVVDQLLAGLQALGQVIVDALTDIFVPSADFITTKVDALRARFAFADAIIVTGEAIRDSLDGFGSGPPIIYAELANSRGLYNWGVRSIALDLTWYDEYKPTVDGIISSFLWLMFAWKMFVKLSGIINGAGSDAKYVIQHEKDVK